MSTIEEPKPGILRSGRRLRRMAFSALIAAAIAPAAAASGTILNAPQLAERVGDSGFEFRGSAAIGSGAYLEHHIWRFSSDGTILDVGSVGHLWYLGGANDQAIPTARGTWKRVGNQICIQLRGSEGGLYSPSRIRFDGCYDVLTSPGKQVTLVGPQILNGTIEAIGEPASAPTANLPQAAPRERAQLRQNRRFGR